MATMQVEVVSAEKRLFSGEATEVYARSLDGEIGILPGHQPALLALDIAPVKIKLVDGTIQRVAIHQGFLYFQNNHLVVLADIAELPEQIDRAAVEDMTVDGDDDSAAAKWRAVQLDVAS